MIGDCFGRAGASANFVHAVVPYSRRSLADLIGMVPDASVSRSTAAAMAQAAYRLSDQWSEIDAAPRLGVGVTACLPTASAGDDHPPWQVFLAAKDHRQTVHRHRRITSDKRPDAERQTVAACFELLREMAKSVRRT